MPVAVSLAYAVRDASADVQADREVVLVAVARDWRALVHAAEELKGDRELVLAAVKQNGRALEFGVIAIHLSY